MAMQQTLQSNLLIEKLLHAHLLLVAGALAVMYGPTFYDLLDGGPWSKPEQAHGPIVFGISLWLLFRRVPHFMAAQDERRAGHIGWPLLLFSVLAYVVGRSQSISSAETGSFVLMLVALVLIFRGAQSLKSIWFPLLFMCFMVPLPGPLVDAVTMPMKIAVSYVAETLLYQAGYPIARTGVILQIGQYQLLVADACAGLHTLFTLEALGLLYLNLVRHESVLRNVSLAVLIVPISFAANVIRVIVLTLITYHLGDEAGQGFLHSFAGMVLFVSALALIIAVDSLIRILFVRRSTNDGSAVVGAQRGAAR